MQENNKQNRLISLQDWNKYHPWPHPGSFRYLLYNREKNGLDKVIKKVGQTILVDEQKFFEWVNEQDELSIKKMKDKAVGKLHRVAKRYKDKYFCDDCGADLNYRSAKCKVCEYKTSFGNIDYL